MNEKIILGLELQLVLTVTGYSLCESPTDEEIKCAFDKALKYVLENNEAEE